MPVILATQEAEIRRIKASPGKEFTRVHLENTQHKIGLVELFRC
jgi:hypothetical protein